jgi:hypothetical protein
MSLLLLTDGYLSIYFYTVGMKILEKALAWKAQAAAMAIGGPSVDLDDDDSLAKKRKVD